MHTAVGETVEPAADCMESHHTNDMAVAYICKVINSVINGRPGRCPEIPEILKFVLKCPKIGVRS